MTEVTPRMLKAAWTAFRGTRTGPLLREPGPAFREALGAALSECDEIKRLRAREARLREALNYYAKNHYPNVNDGPWGANSVDFGNVARAALAKQEEK